MVMTLITVSYTHLDVYKRQDERYIPSNLHLKECIEEKIDHFQYHFFPEGRHSEYDWSQRVPLFLKMFYKGE